MVEEIWVNVEEGAQRTGYHIDHVRRLARESLRLPEHERLLRVRKAGHAYAIWLPDLMSHLEKRIPEDMRDDNLSSVEAIWVNAGEAAQITGYSPQYITRLAMKMQKKSAQEREIDLRKRSNRYEMWLPDLMNYMKTTRLGRPSKNRLLTPNES